MGTRSLFDNKRSWNKDHPHAYGDKSFKAKLLTPTRGSSPRVWGQVLIHIALSQADRIIPTRMGTSIAHGGADLDE